VTVALVTRPAKTVVRLATVTIPAAKAITIVVAGLAAKIPVASTPLTRGTAAPGAARRQ
jgi:hypothetical protein